LLFQQLVDRLGILAAGCQLHQRLAAISLRPFSLSGIGENCFFNSSIGIPFKGFRGSRIQVNGLEVKTLKPLFFIISEREKKNRF
jgi:hypothetical protein